MMRSRLPMAAAVVVVAGLAACGGDDGGSAAPAGCRAMTDENMVTIVAKDVAWDTDCLSLPADTDMDITIDNRDAGVNHNFHVLGLPDGSSPKTNLEQGPVKQHLTVRAPAGRYVYVCDVHPNMKGDLEVG
jgi:plastocyanin